MHVKLANVHTTTKRLSNGLIRVYAYRGRNGPQLCHADGQTVEDAYALLQRKLAAPSILTRALALGPVAPASSGKYITGLIGMYRSSPKFQALAASTRAEYNRYLTMFDAEFGEYPLRAFERWEIGRELVEWRNEYQSRLRKADYMMATVSAFFKWLRGEKLTNVKPTEDIEPLYTSDRADKVYTDDEMKCLLSAGGTDELKWAIRLASITGLRQGDLLVLPWSAIRGNSLVWKTGKTGTVVILPTAPLKDLLDEIPRRCPVILTSSRKRPWTKDGLESSFSAVRARAGIEGKDWHDFRGTAATRLAAAGLPAEMIATWMGWEISRIRRMISIYVSSEAVAEKMLAKMNPEQQLQTADKPTCD